MSNSNHDMEHCISNLNGYCHALRRLSENELWLIAYSVEMTSGIEGAIDELLKKPELVDAEVKTEHIIFTEVEKKLESLVFSQLINVSDSIRDLLAWDFYEYYGLASTMSGSDDWNPLVDSGAWLLDVNSIEYQYEVIMIVPYQERAIVTIISRKLAAVD